MHFGEEKLSLALGIIKSQIAGDVINESIYVTILHIHVHIVTCLLLASILRRQRSNSFALRAHPSAICLLTFAKYFVLAFICTISFNSSYIKRISRSYARNIGFISSRCGTSIVALCCLIVFRG